MKTAGIIIGLLVIAIIVGLVVFLAYDLSNNPGQSYKQISGEQEPPPEFAVVAEVPDSLTIKLDTGHKVRYLGVRTPSTGQVVQCFGKEALQANEAMIGKTVRLEEDPVLTRAQDGAWLRYVWVAEDDKSQEAYSQALSGAPVAGLTKPNAGKASSSEDQESDEGAAANEGRSEEARSSGEVERAKMDESAAESDQGEERAKQQEEDKIKEYLVNERILEMGLGYPLLSSQMVYYDKLSSAARFSSATKRGLWGKCEINDKTGMLETQVINDCVIKGVVLSNGTRVYRTPGCRAYKDTVVLRHRGEKWLCSEEEAQEAGFEKARDCK